MLAGNECSELNVNQNALVTFAERWGILMSVLAKMRSLLPELSKSERKVADYLLQAPADIQRFSSESIANYSGTSRNAVIRLCKKLGYSGYAEFKYAVTNDPDGLRLPDSEHEFSIRGVLNLYCEGFRELEPLVGSPLLRNVSEAILYSNRVVTMGMLHSYYSASQMAFRLNRSGIDCHAIADSSIMSQFTKILKAGDVAVIFSISGQKAYEPIASAMRQNRIKVILVTMNPMSALSKMVDHVIVLPFIGHTYSGYMLDDAVTFFMFIELLVEDIHKKWDEMTAKPEPWHESDE